MRIGIIKEGRLPPDTRAPLTPVQASFLRNELDLDLVVESSPHRCFSDDEYQERQVPIVTDISDRDILLGLKEVPVNHLIPGKTYFFFSHTIKKQDYNLPLLRAIIEKKIRLIDYEILTNILGQRLIAFGHFAGMVGAHNAIWAYGQRTRSYQLPRMHSLKDYQEAKDIYTSLELPGFRVALTGTGRVGTGALQVLKDLGIKQIEPDDFLAIKEFSSPVFSQLQSHHYAAHKDGGVFDKNDFYYNPTDYISSFWAYATSTDIFINGIYWDTDSPPFFTIEQMRLPDFRIQVIADISCDIAPNASIPCTIRSTTIDNPLFGFDPVKQVEVAPHTPGSVDVMSIDNLPNELPRDASESFGKQFIKNVLGELLKSEKSQILQRATVAENGRLGEYFKYLRNWVYGLKDYHPK